MNRNEDQMSDRAGWNLDNSYARLPKAFYATQMPNPVKSPSIVVLNKPLAAKLGLDASFLESEEGVAILAGNQVPKGAEPLAQAYAGHQFGHFSMLGDGRAVLIGEQIKPTGERVDIQLKGSGETPFSRRGDGRAALGPMLREYIISEAMHGLRIPTTRSLAVVSTGEMIRRETLLPGAILTRIAASHLRVGTFQYAAALQSVDELRSLADYAIQRHFPEVKHEPDCYLYFLKEVIKRQAALIAKWMHIGFIHGVMNTDNMAISGETIDYGPCAFMDRYYPVTVFSSIDTEGRYAYGNQPRIGAWNLARLAESLLPLLHENQEKAIELAQEAIADYEVLYNRNWLSGMRAKLGLFHEEENDISLIDGLLRLMKEYRADYTNTFRALTLGKFKMEEENELFDSSAFADWKEQWESRLNRQKESKESSTELMRNSNPSVIPRNHRVEEALDGAVKNGDYRLMQQLLDVLSNPYAYTPEQDAYTALPAHNNLPYRTFCGT